MEALICPQCGAPLPPPAGTVSGCVYCGSTLVGDGPPTSGPTLDAASRMRMVQAFVEHLKGAREITEDAVRDAARRHLGPVGASDVVPRVTMALIEVADRQHGLRLKKDPMVVARIVEAYLGAFVAIRAEGKATIDLPFLTANASGPVHFKQELTVQSLSAMASKKPKRRWWSR